MKKALVLSGGGSRGAYQFGVWKALKKMRIKIDIVTGTSIGALNGVMIVQNDFKKAQHLWENLNINNVFDKEIDIKGDNFKLFIEYFKAFIKEGGMDVSSLENLIKNNVNINKFYKSKIKFGLVTFKLNTLSPVLLKKEEIKESLLVDYLVASATCYPAFKKKKIGDDVYIDGGYYDNLPINFAFEMGAEEIIAVDVNMLGINKHKNKSKDKIVLITPTTKLGNFLVFNKEESKRQIKIGFNDTLKRFGKLLGKEYAYKKNIIFWYKILYLERHRKNIIRRINPKIKPSGILKSIIYDKGNYNIIETIEYLCKLFKLDVTTIYGISNLNKVLLKELGKVEINDFNEIKLNQMKDLINIKTAIKYIYSLIEKDKTNELSNIALVFPKEFIAAMYLYTIKQTKYGIIL